MLYLAALNFLGYSLKFFVIRKISRGAPLNFFANFVARGSAVQIMSDFPAKRLSIYRKKNFGHTFNWLSDFYLIN